MWFLFWLLASIGIQAGSIDCEDPTGYPHVHLSLESLQDWESAAVETIGGILSRRISSGSPLIRSTVTLLLNSHPIHIFEDPGIDTAYFTHRIRGPRGDYIVIAKTMSRSIPTIGYFHLLFIDRRGGCTISEPFGNGSQDLKMEALLRVDETVHFLVRNRRRDSPLEDLWNFSETRLIEHLPMAQPRRFESTWTGSIFFTDGHFFMISDDGLRADFSLSVLDGPESIKMEDMLKSAMRDRVRLTGSFFERQDGKLYIYQIHSRESLPLNGKNECERTEVPEERESALGIKAGVLALGNDTENSLEGIDGTRILLNGREVARLISTSWTRFRWLISSDDRDFVVITGVGDTGSKAVICHLLVVEADGTCTIFGPVGFAHEPIRIDWEGAEKNGQPALLFFSGISGEPDRWQYTRENPVNE